MPPTLPTPKTSPQNAMPLAGVWCVYATPSELQMVVLGSSTAPRQAGDPPMPGLTFYAPDNDAIARRAADAAGAASTEA